MRPSAIRVSDYRSLARKRIPRFLFDYIDGGANDERTLLTNSSDLQEQTLRQRVLRDVSNIDLTTDFLGEQLAMPVILAPVGFAGFGARRGEVQAAVAAEAAGIPFCLSTLSICSLDEVQQAIEREVWFQLYVTRDRWVTRELLKHARSAGCTTLVLTVDLPVAGIRYRDYRSGASGASGLGGAIRRGLQMAKRPRWVADVGILGGPHQFGNLAPHIQDNRSIDNFVSWISENFDPSVTWSDFERIRSLWPGKLVVKGILDTEDAQSAVERGADAIVVSNHGGRQLDSVSSTTNALPNIVNAVGSEIPIVVDGGIRSGLDVVKMLALGANAVMVGRAWAYALAAEGRNGVRNMASLIEKEMRVAMALTGCNKVSEVGPQLLEQSAASSRSAYHNLGEEQCLG